MGKMKTRLALMIELDAVFNESAMMRTLPACFIAAVCLSVGSIGWATVRLPEVVGDHTVLRQNANVSLWGFACAGETVTVEASWGVTAQAVADPKGNWVAKLRTPAARPVSEGLHPETITFTSSQGNNVQIKDVLIGEVWLASGQSNMKMWQMPSYPSGANA